MRIQIQRGLNWAKYCLAGAIGGVALANTIAMIGDRSLSGHTESLAMAVGAVALGTLVKILHVV